MATAQIETPLGPVIATATDTGITSVQFVVKDARVDAMSHPHLSQLARELGEYFAGQRTEFTVPYLPAGSAFDRSAWSFLSSIPFGETRSYGQQAKALGAPSAARAVGGANGRNPLVIVVPCHRVIGANGKLTGFSSGIDRKRWLLDHERQYRLNATEMNLPFRSRWEFCHATPCYAHTNVC